MLRAALFFAATTAGAPSLDQTDLFESKRDGYAIFRIPGVVTTAKGTVLAYCEARKSERGDWGHIDLLARRSTDGGKTFGPPKQLPTAPGPHKRNPLAVAQKLGTDGEVTYNNPVMIADRDGRVHLLFCVEYMRCYYCRSADDGQTWSAPREITSAFENFRDDYDWKVLATGPGHGIQLKGGRLVVPVWLSTGTGGHAHRPSVTATVVSDDGGTTWTRGDVAVPNTADWVNPNEATVAELPDGRVMLNARTESKAHRRVVTVSADGATKWSPPAFDDALVEPICFGSLLTTTGPRPLLVFSHPNTLEATGKKPTPGVGRDRKNVSLQASADGGKTWGKARTVEAGWSAYSDLAPAPDGGVYLFYERARMEGTTEHRYGRLTLARIPVAWLRGE